MITQSDKKKCIKCLAELPLNNFYKAKTCKDGLSTCCKACAREYYRKCAKENPEKYRMAVKKCRAKYASQRMCFYCGKEKGINPTACNNCQAIHRTAANRYVHKTRREALTHYGNKCACCGETKLGFLTLDHPNNDGASHRRATNCGTGAKFYQWLKKNNYPLEFQALCWNCNCGKRDNGGVCPHVKENYRAAA